MDTCLAGRDLTEPTLSPDGSTAAFVVRWGASSAIVTLPADGGPERLVTTEPSPSPGRGLGGGCFGWHPDGRSIVYAARDGQLWQQPVPGGPARCLTAVADGAALQSPTVSPRGDGVVAVLDQAEVWWYPLTVEPGGGPAPRRLDDGSADFCLDPFVTPAGTAVHWTAWSVPDMPWDAAHVVVHDLASGERERLVGTASIQQPGTLPDGRPIAVRDDTGWLNVHVGDEPLVDEPIEHAGPTWGPGQRSFAVSPDGGRIAFTRNEGGFGRLCVAPVDGGTVEEVARGVHGQLSWAGDRVGALRTGARTPTQIVSYDAKTWERTVLAVGPVGGWEDAGLPEPELVEVTADDGVTIHARRYVAGNGRALCWIHGGPTDQWQVTFMPRIAYWWSRGWDVLVPDPRGTTGHGREYQQALRGRWGELDVDDTAAVLRASHDRGWSRRDRTVMMGSSSGGLTALGVLGRHRGLAAGAVVLYPVTDLAVLAEESHRFEAHYTLSLVGPLEDVERYRELSPVSYCDRIDVPVLLVHGDSDPVVPLSSSVIFADRMRSAGGDIDLVVYEGEGHGFRDPANKRDEYARTAAFLRRVVG